MSEMKNITPSEAIKDIPSHLIAEFINGRVVTQPRPALRHSKSETRLLSLLTPPFDMGINGPGGWVILAEPEIWLDQQILVPDLAGWRKDHAPDIANEVHATIAPDWICEILSPSTARYDIGEKKDIYAEFGISFLWFIDPVMRSLQTFELTNKEWKQDLYIAGNQTVNATPFDSLDLDLSWLWEPEEEETNESP